MKFNPIRWSGDDRYFGPFTYAKSNTRELCIFLSSGGADDDDCPNNRLRVNIGHHTLITPLPSIIRPLSEWVDTSRYKWSSGGGYYQNHRRMYGFSAGSGSLRLCYGPQSDDSRTDRSKFWFYPWRETRHIRHSLYDLDGELFSDLPEWDMRSKNKRKLTEVITKACPVRHFSFLDIDGEQLTARTRIEEREWVQGAGWFRWLKWFVPNTVKRSLDIYFSAETGSRKGTWKGGTVGHSIEMRVSELHERAFQRYCEENGMTFVGEAQPVEKNDE